MKKHTRVYLNFFGFKIPEDCFCEVCGNPAVDINHIDARGMGGNPSGDKDKIQNLMATCRECHIKYGDVPELKEVLEKTHKLFMNLHGKSGMYAGENKNVGFPVAELELKMKGEL